MFSDTCFGFYQQHLIPCCSLPRCLLGINSVRADEGYHQMLYITRTAPSVAKACTVYNYQRAKAGTTFSAPFNLRTFW